jgi:hypothetical protein
MDIRNPLLTPMPCKLWFAIMPAQSLEWMVKQ